MTEQTTDANIVSKEAEEKFHELNKIPEGERSEEQRGELKTLKDNYNNSARDRIKDLNGKYRNTENLYMEEKTKREELEKRIADLEVKPTAEPKVAGLPEKTVTHEGKGWYTNAALRQMIDSGSMDEGQAYEHQRLRDRAEDREIIRTENKQTNEQNSFEKERLADIDKIVKDYPHSTKNLPDGRPNPDYNPNDPLLVQAMEIFNNGYNRKANGLSLAIALAKRTMRTNERIDNTENLSLDSSGVNLRNSPDGKEISETTITEIEKENAIQMFRNQVNAATNRFYTPKEAVAKYVANKKRRSVQR